jgi:hypothetical protein
MSQCTVAADGLDLAHFLLERFALLTGLEECPAGAQCAWAALDRGHGDDERPRQFMHFVGTRANSRARLPEAGATPAEAERAAAPATWDFLCVRVEPPVDSRAPAPHVAAVIARAASASCCRGERRLMAFEDGGGVCLRDVRVIA